MPIFQSQKVSLLRPFFSPEDMLHAFTISTYTVEHNEPRCSSLLSAYQIAEERGIETPHVSIIEAPSVTLPVALRVEIFP
jgi:hypothetical protein